MNRGGKAQGNRSIDYQTERFTRIEATRQSRLWAILGMTVLVLVIYRMVIVSSPTLNPAQLMQPSAPSHLPEHLLVKPKPHLSDAPLQGLIR
jgi:hypothetical protein